MRLWRVLDVAAEPAVEPTRVDTRSRVDRPHEWYIHVVAQGIRTRALGRVRVAPTLEVPTVGLIDTRLCGCFGGLVWLVVSRGPNGGRGMVRRG